MEIPAELHRHLEETLKEAFPEEIVTSIRVQDVSVDLDSREIKIVLEVDTEVDPKLFARGYFGLTSKIRNSLSREQGNWGKFFPVITPSIGHGAHA